MMFLFYGSMERDLDKGAISVFSLSIRGCSLHFNFPLLRSVVAFSVDGRQQEGRARDFPSQCKHTVVITSPISHHLFAEAGNRLRFIINRFHLEWSDCELEDDIVLTVVFFEGER